MAELVTMPKLGFDMAEGTLVRWVKAESDSVEKGEVIAEIETDKATVEVESSFEGVMFRHLAEEGTALPVNAPIAVIADAGEEPTQDDIDSMVEAAGGSPSKKKSAKSDDKRKPDEKQEKVEKAAEKSAEREDEPDVTPAGGVRSSPLARRIAEDNDLSLTEIEGSGPQGRVVKADVEAYLESTSSSAAKSQTGKQPVQPLTSFAVGEAPEDEVIEMSRLRQAIGRRMGDSNQNFPHFYLTRAYETGELMALRKELNELLPESDQLSVNDFVVKAVALALRQYPNLNASLQDEKHIVRHGHVNIGVAVAVEGGLLTVVVKDADQKPIRLIAREVRERVGRAREGKVKNDDIEGSTFSISNLGMYGIDNFAAIINPPEAGILAVGAVQKVPLVKDGVVTVGSQMKATISADHRVTDGAEAAEFMRVLASYLEEPKRLLL
ncbi:MAG: dihydrolipoamide acetyltransferase family protein [Chloroflexota bacterium]|nr:dihydrolipoamide acetyltransferase family protein [Chloroflexota bacterium]